MSNFNHIADLMDQAANKIATAESILRSNYSATPEGAELIEQLKMTISDVDYATYRIKHFLKESHDESQATE